MTEYILAIVLLLAGVFKYDLTGKPLKYKLYYLVGSWLILLSAFQYRMGADITGYMGEFNYYSKDLSWKYLSSMSLRQPLWMLTNILCKSLVDNFVLLKTVQALTLNVTVLWFIKKNTRYPYLVLLLYFLILYLPLNFNELRQSFTIAFFLIAVECLKKGKQFWFYFLLVVAFMYHEAAIFFIMVPILCGFRYTKSSLIKLGLFLGLIALFALTFRESIIGFLFDLLLLFSGYTQTLLRYFSNDYFSGFQMTAFGLIEYFTIAVFYIAVLYINITKLESNKYDNAVMLSFLILHILNGLFPIFYRSAELMMLGYIIYSVRAGVFIYKRLRIPKLVFLIPFLFWFLFIHDKYMFNETEDGVKPIVQFYPYTSIIDEETVPERERVWGGKELDLHLY